MVARQRPGGAVQMVDVLLETWQYFLIKAEPHSRRRYAFHSRLIFLVLSWAALWQGPSVVGTVELQAWPWLRLSLQPNLL